MKYIRTKDNVYEAKVNKYHELVYKKNYQMVEIDDIIKEADTIEELCDRFIAETEDNTKFWIEPTLENAKMYCGIRNIYGAIWTDKGLIYVAKMNDKGELELI